QTLYLKRGGETTAEAFDDAYAKSVAGGEEQVRRDVRELVDAELGGKIPSPVRFATSLADGEASEGE
ncbi:MAG: hypothetical protein PVJ73_15085, partial [Acidobacteriota bacterium]